MARKLSEVYARERRLDEREYEEKQKAARRRERQEARQWRADDELYKQRQRSNANAESEELRQLVEDLKRLHVRFVNDCGPLDFAALLRKQRPAEFVPREVDYECMLPAKYHGHRAASHPEDHRIFDCTLEQYLGYVTPASVWEKLSGSSRFDQERAAAKELYERRRREVRSEQERAWQRMTDEARAQHQELEAKKEKRREWLMKVRDGYGQRDAWGTGRYFERKLRSIALPEGVDVAYEVNYQADARRATILIRMPGAGVVPEKTAVRFVAEHNEFRESKRTEGEVWRIYQAAVASLVAGVVHCVYQSDAAGHVERAIVRAVMPGHDAVTGEETWTGLMTLQTSREDWTPIEPENLKPVECLRALGAVFEQGWKRL